MKLYVEGMTAGAGVKVTGWLEYIDRIPFICQRDSHCGVMLYAVTKITRYIECRDEEDFFEETTD